MKVTSRLNALLWLAVLTTFGACRFDGQHDCEVMERFENGNPKIRVCLLDEQTQLLQIEFYYPDGELELTAKTQEEEVIGEILEYYRSGAIRDRTTYSNGVMQGDSFTYSEDGEVINYNYMVEGKAAYIKTRKEMGDSIVFLEGYIPFVAYEKNTELEVGDTLRFEVGLPIPDSLLGNRKMYFGFGLKPFELADSVIVDSRNEVYIGNDTSVQCQIVVAQPGGQLFYGYLIDRIEVHVFEPFEDTLEVKGPRQVNTLRQ